MSTIAATLTILERDALRASVRRRDDHDRDAVEVVSLDEVLEAEADDDDEVPSEY